MKRHLFSFAGVALTLSGAGQEAVQKPYVERVEVRVRSVLVFITDAANMPLAAAPASGELRASEDGQPVEILAVERVRPAAQARQDAPSPGSAPAPSPVAQNVVPQYLYLDTTALNVRSMPLLVRAITANLDSILAAGTLELVGADPTPRVLLAATRDAEKIRATLRSLPSALPGKERLLSVRRATLQDVREAQDRKSGVGAVESVRSRIRMGVREEVSLIRGSLERLEEWAAARPDDRAGVLYLCNDGFDADPVEVYRDAISSQNGQMRLEVPQLSAELGGEVTKLLARTETTLAGKGLTTIPIALGGITAEYAGNAANFGVRGAAALRRPTESGPTFFYVRPLEPLRLVADATGGEVVSASSHLPKVLDRLGAGFLVTFRARSRSDGRAHPFTLTSDRGDLTIRSPKFLLAGAPATTSIHRAIRTLDGSEKSSDVPVIAALAEVRPAESGRTDGMLRIAANFGAVRDLIEAGATVRLRLSLAVGIDGAEPFTSSQEIDWQPESGSWRYQVPLTWPAKASRIAILVEEISTGLAGTTVVPVPKGP